MRSDWFQHTCSMSKMCSLFKNDFKHAIHQMEYILAVFFFSISINQRVSILVSQWLKNTLKIALPWFSNAFSATDSVGLSNWKPFILEKKFIFKLWKPSKKAACLLSYGTTGNVVLLQTRNMNDEKIQWKPLSVTISYVSFSIISIVMDIYSIKCTRKVIG